MNELITISYENENPTVNGRDLHIALSVETRYNDWFSRMCEYGFAEGKDFYSILSESTGGRPSTDHALSIPMAKEICMLQRSEKGKLCRQYFIKIEEAWNNPDAIIKRAQQILQKRVDLLQAQITLDAPKVAFADAVLKAENEILIGQLAKLICTNGVDIGEKRLFKWMHLNGFLMRQSNQNIPTQVSVERGLLVLRECKIPVYGHEETRFTPMVTPKGQQYFINLFLRAQQTILSLPTQNPS